MATSASLEDAITCCICFHVYRDPQALPCLHTLCKPCIDLLADRGRVECPECREITYVKKIRKDFKTQTLITLIDDHKDTENAAEHSTSNCGSCSDHNKAIVCLCRECDLFLCAGCENGHKRIKVCANHTFSPINDIIETAQSKLEDGVKHWKKQKVVIAQKSDKIEDSIKIIQNQQDKQIAKTNKHFDKLTSFLEKNRAMLHKEIVEINANAITDLKNNKEVNEKLKADIQIKIDMLQQVIEAKDLTTLSEMAKHLDVSLQAEIVGITQKIHDVAEEDLSTIEVIVDDKLYFDVGVKLEKLGTKHGKKRLSVNYNHLRNKSYKLSLSKKTGVERFYRICLIEDKLWCAAYTNGIQVYDLNFALLQEIRSVKHVVGLAEWKDDGVIVACCDGDGLHLINQSGAYLQRITTGSFTDVSSDGKSIFALEMIERRVIIFACENNAWVPTHHFAVENGGEFSDKCFVLDQEIFVSLYFKHYIQQYTKEGREGPKYGHRELEYPIICGVDKFKNILVADTDNNRLVVFYASEQQGHVVNLPWPTGRPEPVDAVIDHDGKNIWVLSKYEPQLVKFSTY